MKISLVVRCFTIIAFFFSCNEKAEYLFVMAFVHFAARWAAFGTGTISVAKMDQSEKLRRKNNAISFTQSPL
jgi:hypothetical protein